MTLLVVEAKVRPTDIDVVHAGLSAKIIFSAFKSRTTPQIDGKVTRVTADALKDERTGEFYYLARVSADQSELAKLKDIQLQAGMPAETLIITGERTMLQYLTQPIRELFPHRVPGTVIASGFRVEIARHVRSYPRSPNPAPALRGRPADRGDDDGLAGGTCGAGLPMI